jgi:hypothetical protein
MRSTKGRLRFIPQATLFVKNLDFPRENYRDPAKWAIPRIFGRFFENIFASQAFSGIIETIGANRPRLHGFHRFLPHLWELFFALKSLESKPAALFAGNRSIASPPAAIGYRTALGGGHLVENRTFDLRPHQQYRRWAATAVP